jgi:hypothetical protein
VGSRKLDVTSTGTPIGTMSGYNFGKMPQLVRAIYAWPPELFDVTDLDSRNYLSLHTALIGDISLCAGIFPASVVYLLRELELRSDELAEHVGRGTLPARLQLSDAQRAFFTAFVKPRPDVAERLRTVASLPRGQKVPHVFPKLALVTCWMTSTAGAFVPELREHLGPTIPVRDAIFSACEGWCSIPMGDVEPGGALAVSSCFFEFIAEDDYARGVRETVTLDALKDGARYFIIFSTSAGLCRYLLGDVVEVCGRYLNTPRIRFVRKAGAASNLVGEKLDEVHASLAVSHALAAAQLHATWFALAPTEPSDVVDGKPGYTLHLELAPEHATTSDDTLRALAAATDHALAQNAADYGRLRAGRQLAPMGVRRVPPGSDRAFRQERVLQGTAEAQIKTAHLVDDVMKLPVVVRTHAGPTLR